MPNKRIKTHRSTRKNSIICSKIVLCSWEGSKNRSKKRPILTILTRLRMNLIIRRSMLNNLRCSKRSLISKKKRLGIKIINKWCDQSPTILMASFSLWFKSKLKGSNNFLWSNRTCMIWTNNSSKCSNSSSSISKEIRILCSSKCHQSCKFMTLLMDNQLVTWWTLLRTKKKWINFWCNNNNSNSSNRSY